MISPTPALVTQREAVRLPRVALWLLWSAYLLPGLFGRDPWKETDISAFGAMLSLAEGRTPWWMPTVGGLPAEPALLPYWLGGVSIRLLGPLLGAPLAARLPFAALLGLVLVTTWYAAYCLARTEAAQPLALAFGGEAGPIDYARAVADGALLALIATLGLLQLGHETTPELAQLASATCFLYGLAASPFGGWRSRLALLAGLPGLAASGAPSLAVAFGAAGLALTWRAGRGDAPRGGDAAWITASALLAAVTATVLGAWGWRLEAVAPSQWRSVLRLFVWFCWPTLPLALWTLWRWRRQLGEGHIAVPLGCAAVPVAACLAMGGSERALMLALPALAVLAAFALPTLQRAAAAAIDWFSVFFFSTLALIIWGVYLSVQVGVPAQPAANVQRLAPGYVSSFSWIALAAALFGTAAWVWLVRWRTGRHRHPLWKSLVLAATGVAMCWLLAMTLWLPMLDYGRSYRPLVKRLARHVPHDACIAAPGVPRGQVAALQYFGGWRVEAAGQPGVPPAALTGCDYLLVLESRTRPRPELAGWVWVASERRPADREEATAVFRRVAAAAGAR